MIRARPRAAPVLGVVALLLAGCAAGTPPVASGLGDLAGEWRGRWLGASGHAMAALSIKPDGVYRLALFLDGGDRIEAGVVTPLPSGRLRFQGASGNGEVRLQSAAGTPVLRFVPDAGGGGGAFRRAP